ncbi:uncharacterized protein BHQ10_010187 [Talaromyces amestolkiae]|uniref:Uncharacterized protein n=1 Tax=Talaromyces amestolkiae TaxID=1196081 RepID=A0A364LED1_TALAM|nr:uncharacterized protein BHQ10_010187 [Talaromyces amestolkiae]RAO74175.1 hypothetical protein BHQ10_010187 [Talaromyces amestolkiae]
MSVGNKSQQSDDRQDFESSDSHVAGSEDAESMIVELDDDGYQDLLPPDMEDIRSEVGDMSGDASDAGASFQGEVLNIEPVLELDDNSLNVHGHDIDTAQPNAERDTAEDLLGTGASFSDDSLHIDPVLEVE